jgi:hypothetical protein
MVVRKLTIISGDGAVIVSCRQGEDQRWYLTCSACPGPSTLMPKAAHSKTKAMVQLRKHFNTHVKLPKT